MHPIARFIILLFIVSACDSPKPQSAAAKLPATTPAPDQRTLRHNFWQQPQLKLAYPAAFHKTANHIAGKLEDIEVTLIPAEQASTAQLSNSALLLIGTPESNSLIAKLSSELPFRFTNQAITLGDSTFSDPSTVVIVSLYPNPLTPDLPIAIATGFQDTTIQFALQERLNSSTSFFGWNPWQYEVYQHNERVLMGKFDRQDWKVDKKEQMWVKTLPDSSFESPPYTYVLHELPEKGSRAAQNIVEELSAEAKAVAAFCKKAQSIRPVDCHLYSSIEQKGLKLHNTQPCQAVYRFNRVCLVADDAFGTAYVGPQNALLLRQLLGRPKTAMLEMGLSISFNKKWQKQGALYWASKLYHSDNLPPLSELLDEALISKASPLVMGCAAASFVEYLIQLWGQDKFLSQYQNWAPQPSSLPQLEQGWHRYLEAQPFSVSARPTQPPYLKGFNFAHEGYAIHNSYGSRKSAAAIDEQAQLGANVIALVPYSYMSSAHQPSFLPFMKRAGTETDEGLIADHYHARKRNMMTVLKPQIWLGGNSWPGDVEMATEEDWAAFFDYYYRWIRHYALLAEIHEMDLFCVGVEFARVSLQKGEGWERLISKIRGIYSGPITYAANWGEEFEASTFWEAVDYIGLNSYYPLSANEKATEAELRLAFEQVVARAKRVSEQYGKPLIFTEIGFTSTPSPWIHPHKDGRGKSYDGQSQLTCYKVVMEVLKEQEDWCQGILWWKYPSYLDNGGAGHTGFTPNNKPAEKRLKEYFQYLP
jgi:hypothetical protein